MKKLWASASIYAISNIIPAAVSFLLLPIYSIYLSPTDYGIVGAVDTVTFIFGAFAILALDRAALRFYYDAKDDSRRAEVFGTFFIGALLSLTFFTGLAILCAPLIEKSFEGISFFSYYLFSFLATGITAVGNLMFFHLQAQQKPLHHLFLTILKITLTTSLTAYLIIALQQGALGTVHGAFFGALAFAPFFLFYELKNFKLKFDFGLFKQGLHFAMPMIPTLLLAWVLNMSDRFFIDHYAGREALGIYSMAYKVASTFLVLTTAIGMAYQPEFFKAANRQPMQTEYLSQLSEKLSLILTLIAFSVALICPELIQIGLDSRYEEAYKVTQVILISHLFSGIMSISSTLCFIQAKKTMQQMLIISGGSALNLLCNYLLIQRFGIMGAAWATTISVALMVMVHYNHGRKLFPISIKLTRLIGIGAGLFGIVFTIGNMPNPYAYGIKAIILLVVAVYILKSFPRHFSSAATN